jgi:hypothetical protein
MKKLIPLVLLALTGCSNLPKDSLVRGLKIGGTLWTPTLDAEVIATGAAAKNLTEAERREILTPVKK